MNTNLQALIGQSLAILNSQFIAIALVKDRYFTWANATMHQIFGYDPDELIGKSTRILFLSDQDYEDFAQALYETLQKQQIYTGTTVQKRKDGSSGWYEYNISSAENYPDTFIGAIIDRTESYLARQGLENSKLLYQSVIKDQTEIITRFLPDGTFLFVNDAYCRLFRKSHAELIGQRWQPIAHPDDLPMVENKLHQMTSENPVVTIENRVLMANGEIRWMQFVNRGIFDAAGTLQEIQAVGRDINLLKQTEAKLRQSENMLQRAQAVGKIGSFEMGVDSEYFEISHETARLFGLDDKTQCSFVDWFSRVHPDDKGHVEMAWRNALQNEPYDIVYRIIVANQIRWIHALAHLNFDDYGQLINGVGTVQDVTHFKQIESDLCEIDRRLELALEVSDLAIWDWDLSSHHLTVGNRFIKLLGYNQEELGHDEDHWSKLIHPNDVEDVRQQIALHLQGEIASFESTHRLRHKDGHWVTVESKGKVVNRDKDFNPLRMIGTILDVTQRIRLQSESITMLKRIEAMISQPNSNQLAKLQEIDAVASLTKRQRQILGMIAAGMTSAESAKRLNLSTKTIISHRQTLMTKLNLHNTAEITRFAIDHHLVFTK